MVLVLFSCRNSQNTTQQENEEEAVETNATETFRLIVSFYSPGNGIDHQAMQSFASFLNDKYPQLVYEKVKWGKEGEIHRETIYGVCEQFGCWGLEPNYHVKKPGMDMKGKSDGALLASKQFTSQGIPVYGYDFSSPPTV